MIDSLTIQERERLAYIEGFTEAATLLARLDDCHAALAQAAIDLHQAENDLDQAASDYENLREENESLRTEIRIHS